MGQDYSALSALLNSIKPGETKPMSDIKCPYCEQIRPRPGTQSCGCGATVFDKPEDPTHKGKDYRGASMQGGIFRNQDLRNADFRGAHLQGCIFSGSDLRGAKFNNAHMQGCILSGANTDGASFDGAHMQGVIR